MTHKTAIATLCFLATFIMACVTEKNDGGFSAERQVEYCQQQVERTLSELSDSTGRIDYVMPPRNIGPQEQHWNLRRVDTPEEWCAGFFPGILWMAGDSIEAARFTEKLRYLAYQPVYDHDLGFIMIGSFLKGWERNQSEDYKQVLLAAADTLATLFNPKAGTMLSWPRNVRMFGGHNTIMDNMINLELLLWASQHGGSPRLKEIAMTHADTTMSCHFRDDATSYHVAVYDSITGEHKYNCTHQGAGDETMWARGQAWAIYGYTMVYQYTHEKRYLDWAEKVTDAYLSALPDSTRIPYWDFSRDDFRDASAAAIVASALVNLSELSGKKAYLDEAKTMLENLSKPPYISGKEKPSFIMHSVGNMPAGTEIDYSINYADYYYLEALLRLIEIQEKNAKK